MGYREFNLDEAIETALDYTRLESPEEVYNFGLALLVDVNDHRLAVTIQDKFGERDYPISQNTVGKVSKAIGWSYTDARELVIEIFIDAGLDSEARFIESKI